MPSGKAKAPLRAPVEKEDFDVTFRPNGSDPPLEVTGEHFVVEHDGTGIFKLTLKGIQFRRQPTIIVTLQHNAAPANVEEIMLTGAISKVDGDTVFRLTHRNNGAAANIAANANTWIHVHVKGYP